MTIPAQLTFDLFSTYVHLEAGGGAELVEVNETFWKELMAGERHYPGWFVTAYHMTHDTSTWEVHPGDELLYLLSGAIGLVLEQRDGERVLELGAGTACVVPRGVWHRQIVRKPGDLLGITFGEGTQHRPVSP